MLSVSPSRAAPGDKVTISATCDEESSVSSKAMTLVKDPTRYHGYIGTVKDVLPGTYGVSLTCHYRDWPVDGTAFTQFFVVAREVVTPPVKTPPVKSPSVKSPSAKPAPPKQVTKVPVGAAATGGGGTAGDQG
jgi:hypothetical protein